MFQSTCTPGTKLEPPTNNVKSGSPALIAPGISFTADAYVNVIGNAVVVEPVEVSVACTETGYTPVNALAGMNPLKVVGDP